MIPLNEVTVVGANAAVLSWPVRARLESIGIVPNKMQIRTSGTGHWQAVPIDASGTPAQSGTLWVFEKINGKWYASGAERLRPNQLNGDKPVADPSAGGLSTLIGNGWLYDGRWGAMGGHNPKPGDIVGFMIASGSTRLDSNSREQERTDIVACRWPDAGGGMPFAEVWREGGPTPVDLDPNPPVVTTLGTVPPPQPTTDGHSQAELQRLSEAVSSLTAELAQEKRALAAEIAAREQVEARVTDLAARAADLAARAADLEAKLNGIRIPTSGHVNVFGTRVPVSFE